MEKTESEHTAPKLKELTKGQKRKLSIGELKKLLRLGSVIHKPIPIKKDGKYLNYVAGYFYPLKWQTLERLNIPSQRIISEVDREEWREEMRKAREAEANTPNDPWND